MKETREKKTPRLSKILRIGLIISISLTFFITLTMSNYLLSERTRSGIKELLTTEMEDVAGFVSDRYREEMGKILTNLTWTTDGTFDMQRGMTMLEDTSDYYQTYASEVNLVDENGIIVKSTNPEYEGYNMADGEQSAEFLCLLNGVKFYAQEFQPASVGENRIMAYGGIAFDVGKGFLQIGMSPDMYLNMIRGSLYTISVNSHIGKTGYLLICDKNGKILSSTESKYDDKDLPFPLEELKIKELATRELFGERCMVMSDSIMTLRILTVYPEAEAKSDLRAQIIMAALVFGLAFAVVTILLTILNRRYVMAEIKSLNDTMQKISEGDLSERAKGQKTQEFQQLSGGINHMVDRLEEMIGEAEKKVESELSMAHTIQYSVLPDVETHFSNRKEFALYATMDAARSVGGDFFDFYMVSDNVVAFLIADVSDKGIPAALFMMQAKSVIKSYAQRGLPVNEVCICANRELCKGNDGGMFVTVWIGFVDLRIGRLTYVHAGHTRPVLFRNGKAEFISQKRELFMGSREDAVYTAQEWRLRPGDVIFLYTDGVTEASNEKNELYGNERLLALFDEQVGSLENPDSNEYCKQVCEMVHHDVTRFADGFPQSDDLTELCFRYDGR